MLFVLQKLSKPTMTYFQKALKGFCLFIFFNYQMISKLKTANTELLYIIFVIFHGIIE